MAAIPPPPPEGLPKPNVGETLIVIRTLQRKNNNYDVMLTRLLPTDDFVARSSDELSLGKGDRVELVERDDEFGDGWFLGRHLANGNTGLFPEGLFIFQLISCRRRLF